MTPRILKRGGLRSVLMVAVCAALGALGAVGSAAAATQHWASTTPAAEVPPGSGQSFTAKKESNVNMEALFGGVHIPISCTGLASSGSASNPATEGAAGTLGPTSLSLSGCTMSGPPNCAIKGGSIPFKTLTGYARSESGTSRLVMKPESGTTMAVIEFEASGGSCALTSLTVSGYIEATQTSESPGRFLVGGTSHMTIGSSEFKMAAMFSLNTPSGQPLVLFPEPYGGEPRWHLGAGEWSLIKSGESESFVNSDPVPLTLNTKVGLGKVEISQCGGYFGGHVENPVGGGAGKAQGALTPSTLGSCKINVAGCYVQGTGTHEMVGVATEVGGIPAVEWTPKSGSTLLSFYIGSVGSEKCWVAASSPLNATGKLITTSLGFGRFSLAASELKIGSQAAPISGEFGLETLFGKSLRLQP